MRNLIKILFFNILIFIFLPVHAQQPGPYKNENKIIISGESNIQDFVVRYYFKKKLQATCSTNTDYPDQQKGIIKIPVDKLIFSNHHMKDDFLNLVHANQYPLIRLFYNPELLGKFGSGRHKTVPITIQITNVKKTYMVPVSLLKEDSASAKIKGQVRIKLSDFKLKPKRYFFGLIRLKNMLNINFILYFYRQNT